MSQKYFIKYVVYIYTVKFICSDNLFKTKLRKIQVTFPANNFSLLYLRRKGHLLVSYICV